MAVTVGARETKVCGLDAVPPGVVTVTAPVTALNGTFALIDVAETTVNVALAPPKRTAVAPERPVPVTVTVVPAAPVVGERAVMVGAATMVKLVALVPVPADVVTDI